MLLHSFKKKSKDKEKNTSEDVKMESENIVKFLTKIDADKIADYEHWAVYLDIKQYYLGRVFIWAKREDAATVDDLTDQEWLELKDVRADLKKMYDQTFNPDLLNMAFLGNDVEHCHCHIVPRYKKPRAFEGITFKDENWGHNYSNPNTKAFKISEEVHNQIRMTLCDSLKEILKTNRSITRAF